jgi:hypothetical protein
MDAYVKAKANLIHYRIPFHTHRTKDKRRPWFVTVFERPVLTLRGVRRRFQTREGAIVMAWKAARVGRWRV